MVWNFEDGRTEDKKVPTNLGKVFSQAELHVPVKEPGDHQLAETSSATKKVHDYGAVCQLAVTADADEAIDIRVAQLFNLRKTSCHITIS